VAHAGEDLRFAPEAGGRLLVRTLRLNDLEGDVASQSRVMGAIHLAHPAAPERFHDLVIAEAGAGGQDHGGDYSDMLCSPPDEGFVPNPHRALPHPGVARLRLVPRSRRVVVDSSRRDGARSRSAAAPRKLKVGDPAPDFVLPGSDGRTYALSAYRGRQLVVLAWFAKAFTEG
jgi:hypothetical protein